LRKQKGGGKPGEAGGKVIELKMEFFYKKKGTRGKMRLGAGNSSWNVNECGPKKKCHMCEGVSEGEFGKDHRNAE